MASYTVSTLGDELFNGGNLAAETADGNGLSLREALALANGNASTDDITFAAALAGGTLFLAQGNGQLSITTDGITIDGDIDGNATADITIDADSAAGLDDATSRIFFISDGAASTISTTLNGLVIRDGVTGASGGAIYLAVDAAITLINSTVSGNSADDEGGGIFGLTDAALTLTNATVSGNSAGGNGGGIYGILNNPITLTNSTVTGNRADGDGGAIYGGTNSTITLTNSIVAGNAAAALGDDLFGDSSDADLAFVGGNVIGSTPEGFASVTGAPTAQVDGVDQAALATVFALVANDPNTGVLSGVLADNGGPVATVAIGRDSVAHDAGDTNVLPPDTQDLDGDGNSAEPLPIDARGAARVIGETVDIGAFEHEDLSLLGDVVWRHSNGTVVTATQALSSAPNNWEIEGTADFDADGDGDILWRHVDGLVVTWELENGQFLTNHTVEFASTGWEIQGLGDFDGDGDSDVIWRHTEGAVVTWEMEDGTYVQNHNIAFASTGWRIDGTGDFDGDGDDDIIWRHTEGAVVTWEMEENAYVQNHNIAVAATTWEIAGTGDFDGDGDADILWRHDEGAVVTWEMQGGELVTNHSLPDVSTVWQIEGTEDFDSDGDSDILWQQDNGQVVAWYMDDGELFDTESFGLSANVWQIAGTGEFDLV